MTSVVFDNNTVAQGYSQIIHRVGYARGVFFLEFKHVLSCLLSLNISFWTDIAHGWLSQRAFWMFAQKIDNILTVGFMLSHFALFSCYYVFGPRYVFPVSSIFPSCWGAMFCNKASCCSVVFK